MARLGVLLRKIRLRNSLSCGTRQDEIRELLVVFAKSNSGKLYLDREEFLADLRKMDRTQGVRLIKSELKAVLNALGERDENAEICRDDDGNPEPDPELRDTEN